MSSDVTRRELLNLAVRLTLTRSVLLGGLAGLSACGGGGGSSQSAQTPPASSSPPPAPTSVLPTIKSLSNSAPTSLSALTLVTENVDTTAPFTVTLTTKSVQGSFTVTPIRSSSDGSIVIPVPLHLDSATGQTAPLDAALTVTQNGAASAPVDLTITELPKLTDLGLTLGQASRAFLNHQQVSLAGSINAQQAIALYPGAPAASPSLLSNLNTSLNSAIMARNDIDRIVSDNSVVIPIGTASDGTQVNFDSNSVDLQDRVIMQYLLAYTAGGTQLPKASRELSRHSQPRNKTGIPAGAASAIVNSIGLIDGALSFKSLQQTFSSPNSSAMDDVIASLSALQTVVTIGATAVAVGAVAVGAAPVIAEGAAAVATYSALAGVVIGSAAIGNDIYNVATNGWAAMHDYGTSNYANDVSAAEQASVALVADTASTAMQAYGVGWASSAADATLPVMEGIFNASESDAKLAAAQLATTVANMAGQQYFSQDASASQQSLNGVPASPSLGAGFCSIDGGVGVANSQGSVLSGLTGVSVGDSSGNLQLDSMADENGQYSVLLPLGASGIDYSTLTVSAYDPITGAVLGSMPLNAAALTSGQSATGPTVNGICNDADASSPDADDPDCD